MGDPAIDGDHRESRERIVGSADSMRVVTTLPGSDRKPALELQSGSASGDGAHTRGADGERSPHPRHPQDRERP